MGTEPVTLLDVVEYLATARVVCLDTTVHAETRQGEWWWIHDQGMADGGDLNVGKLNSTCPPVDVPTHDRHQAMWHLRPLSAATIAWRVARVIRREPMDWEYRTDAEEERTVAEAGGYSLRPRRIPDADDEGAVSERACERYREAAQLCDELADGLIIIDAYGQMTVEYGESSHGPSLSLCSWDSQHEIGVDVALDGSDAAALARLLDAYALARVPWEDE